MEGIIKQAVRLIQQAFSEVDAIYLFGSTATAFERKGSDVDLAVLTQGSIDTQVLWDLSQKLACILKRDVDLIDLWQASTVLRYQIVTTGKLIFCRDKTRCDFFAMTAIAMYLRFNEERKPILDEIQRRGRIL